MNAVDKTNDARPFVQYEPGQLPRSVTEIAAVLREEIYLRGNQIVRLAYEPGFDAAAPQMGIRPVDKDAMRFLIACHCRISVADKRMRDGWREADPPWDLAAGLLAAADTLNLRRLRAVVRAPLVRRDGSLVTTPGYDPQTELYFDFDPDLLAGMTDAPCIEAAEDAIRTVSDLIATFPFVSSADRTVALCAILTAIQRPVLPSAPLLGFDSPTPGTGKSKLATIPSIIATGQTGAMISMSSSDEETNKRFDGLILSGTPVAVIDNIERPLGGDKLCSMLSESSLTIRALGGSAMTRVWLTTTFLATGNNLRLKGDVTRRALIARLDAGVERPELRQFKTDPVADAAKRRKSLIRAALTIISAYYNVGLPKVAMDLGSFEAWCRMVRNPLIWAGCFDPAPCMERLRSDDPALANLDALLKEWHARHGDSECVGADVIRDAKMEDGDLRDLLLNIAGVRGDINARRLGHYLRRNQDRIVNGLQIIRCGDAAGGGVWSVRQAS